MIAARLTGKNVSITCAIHGLPPPELAATSPDAIQLSPLIPGAQALEGVRDASLAALTMLAPPGTIERRYVLALALRAIAPGGSLTALAPKDKGGARLAGELRGFGCEVFETSRRHYRICEVVRPAQPFGLAAAISDGAPRHDAALDLWTQPGVFSWNRPDPGSVLLMQHLPQLSGQGADLGCGLGILAMTALASPRVTRLHLVDIDRRATSAAQKNVADARAHIIWGDALQSATLASGLDFIIMNPPFHQDGTQNQGLGQRFITRAAGLLRKGGTCWLTANRHLPYEAVLQPLFRRITLKADAGGYKIYEAQK